MVWMIIRRGTAERITRVRDQEWMKARRRHAMHVVKYWRSCPEANDVAVRTSSVSLLR